MLGVWALQRCLRLWWQVSSCSCLIKPVILNMLQAGRAVREGRLQRCAAGVAASCCRRRRRGGRAGGEVDVLRVRPPEGKRNLLYRINRRCCCMLPALPDMLQWTDASQTARAAKTQ